MGLVADGVKRLLTWCKLALFWLMLGWTIPYMVVLPLVRLRVIGLMLITGKAPVLGQDLTLLVPVTLALFYLVTSRSLSGLLRSVPVLRPGLFMAYIMAVGTTLTAHVLYLGLLHAPGLRWLVSAGALLLLLLVRALMSWIFARAPAREQAQL